MVKLTNEIVSFAAGNTDHYTAFADYFKHFNKENNSRDLGAYDTARSLSEKSVKINDSFFAEIEHMSGVSRQGISMEAWASNPMVKWAYLSIIDADVMTVLPDVINRSIGLYTDLKYMSLGDVLHLKLKPRTLYTMSKGGHGERTAFRQKKSNGDVFITPIEHMITTYVDMYAVLSGKEDLGNLVTLLVLTIEASMTQEATSALTTGMAYNTYPSQLSIQGAFSTNTLVTLGETVKAYNYNVRPIIAGTATALANVIGDSSLGYRGNYDANGGSINLLKKFYDFDLYQLPQVATGVNYGLALDPDTLYVISPAVDKLVKGAVSNALTNSNQFYENADLTQNYTMRKMYDFQFASSSVGGMYKITG